MRKPNFRVKNGNWLVHRYGDVWVQCQNETRRDRCDKLVAGLAELLQEAREQLDRCTTKGCFQNDPVVDAFLDKISAPTPEKHDLDSWFGETATEPLPMANVLENSEGVTLIGLVGMVQQHGAAINAIRDAVEQLRRDVAGIIDPTGH